MATPIIMPRQGQSVESCILTEWKVSVGDTVAEGDVLAVIETDKASFDLESTAAGKILALFWEADDDVPVLANVAVVGEDGEDTDTFRPEGQASAPVAAEPESSAPAPAPAVSQVSVEPVKGIRKVIAERMIESLQSTAQLTLHTSFELTQAQAYRAQRLEAGQSKVSLNDIIAHGIVKALQNHPELNAHFLGNRIATFEKVHLGVAVDTERGLLVPVIKNASDLSIEQISAEVKKLAGACREGSISPDNLSGGSFTLTNLGMLGVENFTPVLNAPEVAILGVGGIALKPKRTESGAIEYVDTLPLSLTIDHQGVDGAPAARFLQTLVENLEENPGI